MPQELLHRPDVVAALQEVRREEVTKSVAAHPLYDARRADSVLDGALEDGCVEVVPTHDAGAHLDVTAAGGKDPLPSPFLRSGREFRQEGVGECNGAMAGGEVALVQAMHECEVGLEGVRHVVGEDGTPILVPLSSSHEDRTLGEADVLDAEREAFLDPKAGAVEEPGARRSSHR